MTDSGMTIRSLLGLDIAVARRSEALNLIMGRYRSNNKTLVVFANSNLLSALRRKDLSREISSKCIVLNDGLGLDIISFILKGSTFPENLNGTDFTLDLLNRVGKEARIFCFGSGDAVLAKAVSELAQMHSLCVVGSTNGFIQTATKNSELIDAINSSRADVVLVGLGNTRQEEWMLAHADRITAKLIVCVGAFFDFTAGAVYRAPLWARRLRIEWLFRLFQEPSRLWRRYTIDPVVLGLAAIWERFGAKSNRRL